MKLNPVTPPAPQDLARTRQTAPQPSAQPQESAPAQEDSLQLSPAAQDFIKEQQAQSQEEPVTLTAAQKRMAEKEKQLSAAQQLLQTLEQQNEQIREQTQKQTDALKKAMDKMKKCMKIARSIMKGNKVPREDEQYLLENDLKTYMMAMALREMKKDPKKEKSVLDKEDLENSQESSQPVEASGAEAPAAEISEPAAE